MAASSPANVIKPLANRERFALIAASRSPDPSPRVFGRCHPRRTPVAHTPASHRCEGAERVARAGLRFGPGGAILRPSSPNRSRCAGHVSHLVIGVDERRHGHVLGSANGDMVALRRRGSPTTAHLRVSVPRHRSPGRCRPWPTYPPRGAGERAFTAPATGTAACARRARRRRTRPAGRARRSRRGR